MLKFCEAALTVNPHRADKPLFGHLAGSVPIGARVLVVRHRARQPRQYPASVAAMLPGTVSPATTQILATFIAVISVSTGLTAWTDGRMLWFISDERQERWPPAETETAAARLAALAGPSTR